MLFAMNIMIVSGILVCISFLITVCMCIVSKALLISSATVIVHAGGSIWLNPFATFFSLHSSTHCFPTSLNEMRSSEEQGCASWEHCNMCVVVSSALPQAHVVSPV